MTSELLLSEFENEVASLGLSGRRVTHGCLVLVIEYCQVLLWLRSGVDEKIAEDGTGYIFRLADLLAPESLDSFFDLSGILLSVDIVDCVL